MLNAEGSSLALRSSLLLLREQLPPRLHAFTAQRRCGAVTFEPLSSRPRPDCLASLPRLPSAQFQRVAGANCHQGPRLPRSGILYRALNAIADHHEHGDHHDGNHDDGRDGKQPSNERMVNSP
jgi:hypothetical protein